MWYVTHYFSFSLFQLSESISPQQLSFPAYTRQEIMAILTARLKGCTTGPDDQPVLKPSAVSFLAAKIAAVSGDVRKALDVCRRAIEIAEVERCKQAVLTTKVRKSSNNYLKDSSYENFLFLFARCFRAARPAS